MKILRLLFPLAILVVSLPLFALPPCSHCNLDLFQCENDAAPATGIRCRPIDCSEIVVNCLPSYSPVLAADLTIASVEVVTPAQRTVTPAAGKTVRVAAAKLR